MRPNVEWQSLCFILEITLHNRESARFFVPAVDEDHFIFEIINFKDDITHVQPSSGDKP